MPESMAVRLARSQVAKCMDTIHDQFTKDCKVTVIVRKPDNDQADFMMTDDTLDEIAKVIERTKDR